MGVIRKGYKTIKLCIKKPSRIGKGIRVLFAEGPKALVERAYRSNFYEEHDFGPAYEDWFAHHRVTEEEMERQRRTEFPWRPKISVVVPAYKTPETFMRELIESLLAQTYREWELCIADASEEETSVLPVVREYQQRDARIKYRLLEKNRSIPENTNEAIEMATGEYIGFLDHDDVLAPDALFECVQALNRDPEIDVIYTDEDKITMDSKEHFGPHFKPDFNIDLLCTTNYICHFFVVRASLREQAGLLDPEMNGSQDYDIIFRTTELAKKIHHIPRMLYHWRAHKNSVAENPECKMYAYEAGKRAIQAHYDRLGIPAEVSHGEYLGLYRTKYLWKEQPLISIIIPNKDHTADLEKCISSIEKKATYRNYEYVIVENNSTEKKTFAYYKKLKERLPHVRLVRYQGEFNFSEIINYGAAHAKGSYFLLLNNDTEMINADCLEQLLGYCMREDVGAVGARLYYPDNKVQHAGVVVGLCGIAGHVFAGAGRGDNGYFSRIICAQDYSAVTAACMMVKRSVFEAVGGMTPELKVAYNDIDFCLKIRELGKLVVYNPYAELYHHEMRTRGKEDTPEKQARFQQEVALFRERWPEILRDGDPLYNPNLSLERGDFVVADWEKTANS